MVVETEVEHRLLERQPVALALAARDVRMRPAGDHVEHLRMALDDRRQRLDHRLDPLARRRSARTSRAGSARRAAVVPPARRLAERALDRVLAARRASTAGAPCGTTRIFSAGHGPPSTSSARAVSVITITSSACRQSAVEHLGLMRRRLRQHRVQRDDERLRQLLGEREHVLAVAAAEDAVLVLEQDDVDVEPAEDPRRAHVVAADPCAIVATSPGRCGRDGSLTITTRSTRSTPSTPSSAPRTSAAKVPMPQARGG